MRNGRYKGSRLTAMSHNAKKRGYMNKLLRGMSGSAVFVGPSVEGVETEYIKVATGEVSFRRPSYAK